MQLSDAPAPPTTPETTDAAPPEQAGAAPGRVRRLLGSPRTARGLTVLACVIVVVALLFPNVLGRLVNPAGWARIPIEGALGLALLAALPRRPRRFVAAGLGVLLGLVVLEKCLDMGFFRVLARPFDPVLDWELFDDAYGFVGEAYGLAGAIGVAAAVALIVVAALGVTVWAMLRVSALVERRRRRSMVTAGGATLAWSLALVLGVQFAPAVPVAARSTATYAWDRFHQARAGLADEAAFDTEIANDPYANVPTDQMLTALRGKDVVFTFVESYGRTALERPQIAGGVGRVLAGGDAKLKAAGYAARSGWLTSPTFGGGSWLAHATFLSGLWINNQGRYRNLTASDRLTLPNAFRRAGWRTVSVMPGATRAWPEGNFYGYDKVWDSRNLGYQGPKFGWSPMPDQYTLHRFNQVEYRAPGRGPLMTEMPLVSSHTPWTPIPAYFEDWNRVGDGAVYHGAANQSPAKSEVWGRARTVRAAYGKSVEYTLTTLIDWVEKYGDENLVLVFLGDHQPSPVVTGENASHDVPITILAKDPAVLTRIAGWGWTDGLRPDPEAPVWPMHTFRDRFFAAYGSTTPAS